MESDFIKLYNSIIETFHLCEVVIVPLLKGGFIQMKLRKIGSIAVAVSLVFTLGACSKDTKDSKDSNAASSSKEEKIVLKYANWNLGTEADKNLERQMIEAFEEKNKNVDVQIDETISTKDWKASLATAASAGKLPDVFMLNDIPASFSNEWLLDLSEITGKDNEFTALPQSIQDSTKINDAVYAIPFAQHLMGYYVNKNMFNELNLDVPEYGMDLDAFIKAIKDTTDIESGRVGVDSATSLIDWYPGVKDPEVNWFTYADGKYHLDSPEMLEGMATAKDLGSNGYAYEGLTDKQKESLSGKDPGVAFKTGQIALYWNGTWMNNIFAKEANFEWDFVGLPSGRAALASDYLGISKTTKNADMAYEFAKWMSYNKEGFMKRISIADEKGLQLTTLPVSMDQEVLDAYWEISDVPGVKKAYENLETAMLDPLKIVPGYAASRWKAETGLKIADKDNAEVGDLIFNSVYGNVNYQDYAKQLNDLAQQQYNDALAAMNK